MCLCLYTGKFWHPSIEHNILQTWPLPVLCRKFEAAFFFSTCATFAGAPQEHCLFPYTSLAGSFTQTHGVVVSWCTRRFRQSVAGSVHVGSTMFH